MSTQIAYDAEGFFIPAWTFADRIRKARAVTGLGQKEFAEQIGAKASAYAQWEADNNRPRDIVTIAKSIEMLTRIPAAWILGIDQASPNNVPPTGVEPATYGTNVRRLTPRVPAAYAPERTRLATVTTLEGELVA